MNMEQAFPTEERERQKIKHKALKEQGKKPGKKLKQIEEHFDDCGTDLSGLGPVPESDGETVI